MAFVFFVIIFILEFPWNLSVDSMSFVNDQFYSQEIRKGRCMARCYEQYGQKPAKSLQDELYHVYQANDCNSLECKKCVIPCGNITYIEQSRTCADECLPHGIICMSSCEFALTTGNTSVVSAFDNGAHIDSIRSTCQHIAVKGTVTLYLYWNVQLKYHTDFVFVVSMIRGQLSKTWKTLGQITRSVVPIHGLSFETNYKFRVTAVSRNGVFANASFANWITTIKATDRVQSPSGVKIEEQKVHNGMMSALLHWNTEKDPSCFYELHLMTSNPLNSEHKSDKLRAPPISKYWINNLHFGSNYTLHMSSYPNSEFTAGSVEIVTWFVTADCLQATNYNYHLCGPDEPRNVTGELILNPDNTSSCSVNVSWIPPRYGDDYTEMFSYLIKWYKIIPIHLSKYHKPHQSSTQVKGNRTWVEVHDIHWDYNYSISVQAKSTKGHSKPVILIVAHEGCQWTAPLEFTGGYRSNLNLILGGSAGISVIIIVLSLGICLRIKLQRQQKCNSNEGREEEMNPLYYRGTDYITKVESDDCYEIDFSSLILLEVLGEGAFGKVYKAKLNDNKLSKEKDFIVAVKMLKDYHDFLEKKSLLLEIEFMKRLGSHPHIVSFIGCCKRDTICLLMDYCQLGDLRSFLLRYRRGLQTDYRTFRLSSDDDSGMNSSGESATSSQSPTELHQTRLLSYARQIVLAMEYMASRKFIHRDLAARNILMYDEERIKVSDFGLTRDIYERNLYQPTSARKLPYKWMALEAIFDQVFTIKSDVWSFGIVLWEIVTLGGSPYPGIPNKDLFKLLKEGYRMEKPENCSLEVYQLMLSVWHPNPYCRPSFTELRKKLEAMLEQTKPYINLSVAVSKDYYELSSISDHSDRGSLDTTEHTTYVEMSATDSILTYETPLNGLN